MGASLSSFSFGTKPREQTSAEPKNNTKTTAATTPGRKKKATVRIKQEVSRRSQRVARSNPSRVVFPTIPKAKTPSKKNYPLTPKTRKKAEAKSKPILRRKSPRVVKHKIPKVEEEGGAVLKYTPNAIYELDEPVFAWDRGVIYEAKVIEVGSSSNGSNNSQYHVHFLGYKKTQDKWMSMTKMMKVEPSTRKLFRELRNELPEKVDELLDHMM